MLHLQIKSGPRKGETVSLLDKRLPLVIGRDASNNLRIEDSAISRFHAEISSESGSYFIKDLKSTNGTFLNGRRIEHEKIGPGDEIAIAGIKISVEAIPSPIYDQSDHLHLPFIIDSPSSLEKTLIATQPSRETTVVERLKTPNQDAIMKSPSALLSLYKADAVLREIDDMGKLLGNFIDLLLQVIPASRGYVFLLNRDSGAPLLRVRRIPAAPGKKAEVVISETIMNMTVKGSESIRSESALINELSDGEAGITSEPILSSICAPMLSRNKILGFVYLDSWNEARKFQSDDLMLLAAMAAKAATAVDNANLYSNLANLFYNTIETLIRTMQAKDRYTSGHSTRVSRFSLLIADKLGLSSKEKRELYLASVLHDLGKIALPDKLLLRPGKLTEEELALVRRHPQLGVSMLKSLGEMRSIIPLILHHHEAYDGTGYPDGLVGEEIPLMSRIVAVADTYDAITSDRPYRSGRSREDAIRELKRVAGIKLDPSVVSAFLEVLEEISPEKPSKEKPMKQLST